MHQEKLSILTDILGEPSKIGSEYLYYCKKCNHHKKKLSINIDKNCFKCWVCDYSSPNLYRLIKRYGSYTQKQNWLALDGKVDLSSDNFEDLFNSDKQSEDDILLDLPAEFISLTAKNLPKSAERALKYLAERNIGREEILKWKIGYCSAGEYAGRIIIPSFNLQGKINYFIARSYTGDWIKYKNPPLQKNKIIFNELYVDWDSDLIITEGVFDAIIAGNAIPILGSSLPEDSRLFQEIVKNDTPVYIALDPDAEKKAMYLIRDMLKYEIELYKIDVNGYQDVGSMTREEFLERKSVAKQINSINYLNYELMTIY